MKARWCCGLTSTTIPWSTDKLNPEQRKKAHRERCYKLVSLLHLRGDCSVYAALAVVPGNAHEAPILYQLVANFVATVGVGVIKLLILDRGFIDGPNLSRCKKDWGLDVLIPIKKNLDLWTDAWALGKTQAWQTLAQPARSPAVPPAGRPEEIVRRERKRQQTLLEKKAEQPPPDPAKILVRTEACPIKGFRSWSDATVPINVVLLRDRYADGHESEWALMTTADFAQAHQPKDQYALRTQIEERHRVLKCFHDLSDFHSRCLNVIVAQVVFILLSFTLRQWQLWKRRQEELASRTPRQCASAWTCGRSTSSFITRNPTRRCPWSPSVGNCWSWSRRPGPKPWPSCATWSKACWLL